jgi:hypothetical protein
MLPAGTYYLTIPAAGADDEDSGDLDLTTPASGSPVISIVGAGATTTVIDANQLDRVLRVDTNRTAMISGVTLQNGYTTGDGGGGVNSGTLTVSYSKIANNRSAGNDGGGIANNLDGLLTLINCTISDNIAEPWGGGITNGGTASVTGSTLIHNHADAGGGDINNFGHLTLTNSTIFNNFAVDGAGLENDLTAIIVNSTISENRATNNGGGIYNDGSTFLFNVTVISNGADVDADQDGGAGAGLFQPAGPWYTYAHNSVIAGNDTQNAPVYDDCYGTLYSYGRNLFWNVPNCNVIVMTGSWDYLNPLNSFGPLQDNGGPTKTHALLPGSNAIDGGDPTAGCIGPDMNPLTTDQRGFPRVAGVRCDLGAFESAAAIFANGFE